MTNKSVIIINSLKVPKINNILLFEMTFLVPNYSCLQTLTRGLPPPDLRSLCPQLNLLNPPPRTKFLGTPLSTAKWLRTALFWLCTTRMVVISYRRFSTNCRSTLRMGLTGCTETSVRNYHYSLRNDPEERSSQ